MSIFEILILSMPLVIVLLGLALMPLIAARFWSKNEIRVFLVLCVVSIASVCSFIPNASGLYRHILIEDYVPFIIMLFTLYTLSHGIDIQLNAIPSTLFNICFLGASSLFSSIIGTTGASMLFLLPFIKVNNVRKHKSHLLIFFIFLVSNIGGLLTPLGDPPLLLGYLHGIEFSWQLKNLFSYWLFYTMVCLAVFYIIDTHLLKKEGAIPTHNAKLSIKISGWFNIFLIFLAAFVIFWEFGNINITNNYTIPGAFVKNAILLTLCLLSYSRGLRQKKKIDFAPFKEVARTFLVIFIVIAPVLFVLNQNSDEIHKYIVKASNGSDGSYIFFWLCSLTSSFLDNAPSYLLFFNMAGGNPQELMCVYPGVLKAISISSVVMGAMTYIGNAPNMMVKSIADKCKIKMPSFIGYMGWSFIIILPISLIVSYIISL